jgi:hypothetical protein
MGSVEEECSLREETNLTNLYGETFKIDQMMPIYLNSEHENFQNTFNLKFPIEKSGVSWSKRLAQIKDNLPKASFKMINSTNSESLEIPKKRGRGRPRKDNGTSIAHGVYPNGVGSNLFGKSKIRDLFLNL